MKQQDSDLNAWVKTLNSQDKRDVSQFLCAKLGNTDPEQTSARHPLAQRINGAERQDRDQDAS